MDEKLKQLLQDYVATANSGKYKSLDEVNAKFPELVDYDKNVLSDYVATVNSGKYSSIDEVNSKFPEFNPKSSEVSQIGSETTSQTSVEPIQSTSVPDQLQQAQSGDLLGQSLVEPNNVDLVNNQSLNTTSSIPKVLKDGNWRQDFQGEFYYDTEGFEYFTPTKEFEDSMGGWDNLKNYFEKEKPNVILEKPESNNAESGFGEFFNENNYANYNTAKRNDLNAIKKANELVSIPFEDWSSEDKFGFFLGNIIKENGFRKTQSEKDAEKMDKYVDETNSYIGESFGRGSASLFKDVLGIPEFAGNLLISSFNGILSAIENESGLDLSNIKGQNISDASQGTILEDVWSVFGARDVIQQAVDRSTAVSKKFQSNEEGVWENAKSGNISEASDKLGNMVGEMLPFTMLLMATGGGASSFATGTLTAGSGKYDDIRKSDIPDDFKTLNALVSGLGETGTELIGNKFMLAPLERLIQQGSSDIAKKTLSQSLMKAMGKFHPISSTLIEATTEVASTIIDNLADKVSGVDRERNVLANVPDTIIGSLALSGGMQTLVNTSAAIVDKSNLKSANSLLEMNTKIQEALNNPGLNNIARDFLKKKYQDNLDTVNSYVLQEQDAKSKLSKSKQDLVERLEQSRASLESIINDPNVPEAVKAEINSEIEDVNNKISTELMITTKKPSTDLTPERIDESVLAQRKATPELENAPMGSIEVPDSTFDTIAKIESKEAVDSDEITKAVDSLYEKKKELKSLKKDSNRLHTISEIDLAIENIDKDLEMLSTEPTPPAEKVINITEIDFNSVPVGEAISYGDNQTGIVKASKLLEDGSVDLEFENGEIINSKTIENDSTKVPVENIVENVEVAPVGEASVPAQEVVDAIDKMTDEDIISELDNIEENGVSSNRDRYNKLEKELEQREWDSIQNVDINTAKNNLEKLKAKKINVFAENSDINESIAIINKYENTSDISDNELKTDFTNAIMGNPESWNADNLKLKLAVQESINRGLNEKSLIDSVVSLFTKDGFSEDQARKVIADKISKVRNKNVNNNESVKENTPVTKEIGQADQEVVAEPEQVKETRSNFADESEYNKYVAETSTNPDEVAVAYYNSTPIEYDFIEQGIMDDIGSSKINESDYARYGDKNNLDKAKRDRWIDKDNKGISLDVAAEQLSRKLGVEVDPSEYIEFIDRYKNPTEFKNSNISDSQKMLKDKYKELTGRNLTDKVARRTRDRVNRNMTDEQRYELNESLQEVGITYDDIVNYEKYIEETTRSNAVGVQQSNNDQSRSKAESPRNQDVQGREKVTLPKTVLEGVLAKLKKTGLANNIKVENTEQIDSRKMSLPGMFVKGFVDTNGDVVINSDTATLDTPIHEFGHLWTSEAKKNNPDLYQKGIDLIDTDSAKPYIDEVKRLQPSLEGTALKEEVLAQIIGDQGAKLIQSNPKTKTIREWLKNVWADIMKRTGISGMTPDQLSNISLEQFAEGVAIDLLQGKSFAVNKDGSLDVKVNLPESGKISPAEQRKIDLINKFKNRAGIQYQALANNNVLSSSDLKEFHELAEIVINDGTVNTLAEFRSFAKDIGITDKTQVDMIYKSLDKSNQKASGIKKALVDDITVDTASFEKKTDAEVKDMGKQLVDSGVIDPADLIADIITNPKALQPYEVAALVYYKSKLDSEIDALETNTTGLDSDGKPMEYGGVTGMDAVNAKLEMKEMQLADFQMMSLITANQQSQAFRLRDMMVDSDFNIVSYIEDFKRLNKGYISPEKLAEFNALAKRVGELERSLKRAEKKREEAEAKIGQNNIQQASKQAGSTKPRISSKKVKEATAKVIASIDPASFGLVTPRFQTNDVVRFSVVPDTVLTDAVNEALSGISTDINNGVQIGDAVENAISSIDSKVGAGKWNSAGFRSAVINQYVSEGVKVNSKKPYVSSSGNLVVPSEYLKDIVRDGKETVEDMVEAVHSETDNKYSDYEIRNAISGYGKVATGRIDDITKKLNVAKRIAQKLSEIEDLQSKGSRAKTPKRAAEIDSRLEALKQEVNELERLAGMTPEEYEQFREEQSNEKTNERRRKYIQDHILELEQKIANKDFAPKDYSPAYVKDAETLAMEEELIKARNKFKQEKARVEFENRSKAEKVTDVIIDGWNALRTQAGMDLSSILVQGGLFAYSNPRKALEIFRAGKDVVLSNKDVDNYFDSLQADPMFEVARKAKLRLQLPSFYNQLQEEQFHGNIMKLIIDDLIGGTAGKIVGKLGGDGTKVKEKVSDLNPFNIGDRHYAYTLSATRMHMFKKFAADAELKNGSELTPDQFKRIANLVNDLTFASGFGKLEGKNFNKWAGIIFYSLPKAVATFKLMSNIVPHQFFHNAKMVNGKIQFDPVSVAIGRELYSNYLLPALTLPMAAIGGYVLAGALAGDDEDKDEFTNPNMFNPIHTDFMKLKFGNTRVSSTFGMETIPTLISRVATGTYMTSSSNEVKETGEGRNFTKGDIIGRFIRNKFAPAMSLTWEHLNQTATQELEYGKKVRESFTPMWITSGIETYEKTDNIGLASTLGVLGIIGANYNTYGGAEFAQKIKAPKSKKIIEESGLSVYNPTPGSIKVIDADKGVKSEPIDSKELKDKFIPIYAQAMDNLVLTKQKNLAPDLGVSRKSDAINQMKGEALDYAKFKTSGVMTGFDSFVSDGTRYKLKPDQYPVKKKAIDEYMSNRGPSLIEKQKQSIKKDLIKEGFTPTDGYIQMVAEREVYKKANAAANKIIKKLIREGTLKVIESKDFKDKESDSE